jgi:hypothetical protein
VSIAYLLDSFRFIGVDRTDWEPIAALQKLNATPG